MRPQTAAKAEYWTLYLLVTAAALYLALVTSGVTLFMVGRWWVRQEVEDFKARPVTHSTRR